MKGRAHILGDFVNTDEHASDKYKPVGTTAEEVQRQLFEGLRPGFARLIRPGDFIVAGQGFGTVSPRIDAAVNIRAVGVSAVLARSFGMLFFRNAINIGLPCIQCDTSLIRDGEVLHVDLEKGLIVRTGIDEKGVESLAGAALKPEEVPGCDSAEIRFTPFPPVLTSLLQDGGLLPHLKKHGGYAFS